MNSEELALLKEDRIRELIERNLGTDPREFALRHAGSGFPVAPVAGQLKSLQRAKRKLPRCYEARCILPPRAFEQSSSELAARMKPFGKGKLAIDLCCGLGIDTMELSRRFEKVIALEADPVLAEVTRHNLKLLDIRNVEVLNTRAEEFLESYKGPAFDLLFVDPDRRDAAGRRHIRFADCSPNVLALLPEIQHLANHILIKASPILDISAGLAELGASTSVFVLAIGNECKEMIFQPETEPSQCIRCAIWEHKREIYRFEANWPAGEFTIAAAPTEFDYVYEADVALYKAELTPIWWLLSYPGLKGGMSKPEGYFFSDERLEAFPGRAFKVLAQMPYKVPRIKAYLKEHGIQCANLSRRGFDIPLAKVKNELRIADSGDDYLLFTRLGNQRIMVHGRRMA